MGRNGAAHEPAAYCYDHVMGEIVNVAAARFVSERRPIMPSFWNAIKWFDVVVVVYHCLFIWGSGGVASIHAGGVADHRLINTVMCR